MATQTEFKPSLISWNLTKMCKPIRWLISAFLVVPNVWRATNYFNHGIGLHVDPRALSISAVSPRPIAFVNAGLMAVIVFLLVRSAWIGFSDRHTRRRISEES